MSPEIESALLGSVAEGERIVWHGRPVVKRALDQQRRSGWQRAAILGGGYSVVGGVVAIWLTGDLRWTALPVLALAICAAGLWSDHRRNARISNVLTNTAYALTAQHAIVVQTQPVLQRRTIALPGAQLVSVPGAVRGVADVIFQAEDGQHLVFSDIADAAAVEQVVDGLKTAPEAVERQFELVAQWAAFARQLD